MKSRLQLNNVLVLKTVRPAVWKWKRYSTQFLTDPHTIERAGEHGSGFERFWGLWGDENGMWLRAQTRVALSSLCQAMNTYSHILNHEPW